MVDNPDLLYRYDQLTVVSAAEWKAFAHSLFVNAGLAMYKEKATKGQRGDAAYSQQYAWIEPGGRFRFFSRFSLVGSVKMSLYQALKEKNPLNPELFNVSMRIEVPIFMRETNTEAIRTLIFLGQRKEKNAEPSAVAPASRGRKGGGHCRRVGKRARHARHLRLLPGEGRIDKTERGNAEENGRHRKDTCGT